MTSWCPGVGVPLRRRRDVPVRHHCLEAVSAAFAGGAGDFYSSEMGEVAVLARRRLEQKLGYFTSSRSSELEKKSKGCTTKSNASLNTVTKRRRWPFRSNNSGESCKEKVCAVCLEEFRGEQEEMSLSCSHKYHSKCLVPWLVSHPHCPCCRTLVQSINVHNPKGQVKSKGRRLSRL